MSVSAESADIQVLSSIQQGAKRDAKRAYTEACISSALATSLVEGKDTKDDLRLPAAEEAQSAPPAKRRKAEESKTNQASSTTTAVPKKPLQGWEVLKAIEKKNLTVCSNAVAAAAAGLTRIAS